MTATIIIASDADRRKAIDWIKKAPWNTRVSYKGPKRSIPQNDLLWTRLTELSVKLKWHGQTLSPEDYKILLMSGLETEMRIVPNINGNGFVALGRSSSKLDKETMGQLLDLIDAFAAQHGVKLGGE